MRINVYTEELTNEVEVIEKDGFHGLRFYLKSPDTLHRGDDDDRSAITFWGLRTVVPLMEQVVEMLRKYREDKDSIPLSINEAKNEEIH